MYAIRSYYAQADADYLGGIADNFAKPTEPAVPGPILQTFCSPPKDFDDARVNRCFGHTFTGLSDKLLTATLEIRLRSYNFV